MTRVKNGLWKPRVHFVWDILLDELLSTDQHDGTTKGSFPEFFRILVDGACATPCRSYRTYRTISRDSHMFRQNRCSPRLRLRRGSTGAFRSSKKCSRVFRLMTCPCSSRKTSCAHGSIICPIVIGICTRQRNRWYVMLLLSIYVRWDSAEY